MTRMQRREFITLLGGAAAAWPIAARAQQPAMPVIGYLGTRTATGDATYVEAFRRGLGESDFIPGQNVTIEFRWADGQNNRLPALAADLVRRRVKVLVSAGGAAAPAAKAATSTIPIVFSTGSDPVKSGLVASLNRPGGNLTGVTTLTRELNAKRVGLLRDLVSGHATIACMIDPRETDADSAVIDMQDAARQIGRELIVLRVRTDGDIETAFATMVERAAGALLVHSTASLQIRSGLIIALATRHSIPAVYNLREWVVAGGLISYGTSFTDSYRNVGVYTGRILRGAKPADLPVMQPTKFELVINLNTAKALKLTIPPGILAIADEVIE
jgi:putative ABC transport system substrate-binding protein